MQRVKGLRPVWFNEWNTVWWNQTASTCSDESTDGRPFSHVLYDSGIHCSLKEGPVSFRRCLINLVQENHWGKYNLLSIAKWNGTIVFSFQSFLLIIFNNFPTDTDWKKIDYSILYKFEGDLSREIKLKMIYIILYPELSIILIDMFSVIFAENLWLFLSVCLRNQENEREKEVAIFDRLARVEGLILFERQLRLKWNFTGRKF